MTNAEYRAHEGISRSELFRLTRSPLHFKYAQDHPEETSPALEFGAACHKYVLELGDFANEFTIAPACDRRTKAGRETWTQFIIGLDGRRPVSLEDYEVIKAMREAIVADKIASEFLYSDGARYEQSFFWTDDQTGEAVKCRPDVLAEIDGKLYIIDYKTADSCEDGHFERACRKYGYKLQAGMYREGVFQNTLDDYGFVFVAQEKKPPYATRTYICSDEFINEGYDQYRELLGLYHYCKESGNWFGYEGMSGEPTDLVGEGEGND